MMSLSIVFQDDDDYGGGSLNKKTTLTDIHWRGALLRIIVAVMSFVVKESHYSEF